jgi:hypothetical protein
MRFAVCTINFNQAVESGNPQGPGGLIKAFAIPRPLF